jgi:hypothetical protein
MRRKINSILGVCVLLVLGVTALYAQDSAPPGDDDESSKKVEQKDDSYRQQMELEDARDRDRTYIDNTYTQQAEAEKIDKLPKESRENIRDQLVDIIVENGEWEPKDALEEYPYAPTQAAEADSELEKQEQEAWDEQIEKYHEREAEAFGSHRGPVPGPGNPDGQEGGQQGEGSQQGQQGQQGGGQGGEAGEGQSGSGSEGTYQPYQSSAKSSEDEVSTAGVSESALDFLRGGQGQQQPQGAEAQAAPAQQQPTSGSDSPADKPSPESAQAESLAQESQAEQDQAAESEQSESEQAEQLAQENSEQAQEEQQESSQAVEIDTRGIIAIKDLDKLEGAAGRVEIEEEEDP